VVAACARQGALHGSLHVRGRAGQRLGEQATSCDVGFVMKLSAPSIAAHSSSSAEATTCSKSVVPGSEEREAA
jgi:hypothetical protein